MTKASIGVALTLLVAANNGGLAQTVARPVFTAADVFKLKGIGDVRISPDGRTIAYETNDADIMIDGARHAIRLIDVASGDDRLLANAASSPRWSPNGRLIAFTAAGASGGTRVMTAGIDNRMPHQVVEISGSPSDMVWSPDGRTIAFTMFVPKATAPMATPVAKPAGANWAALPRVITGVRYEEDGQAVFEPGRVQLFTFSMAGGPTKQITTAPLDVSDAPSWTPDSTSLIYSATNRDELGPSFRNGRIYRIPATGGQPMAMSPAGLSAQRPTVSPDGRSIAFIAWAVDGRDFSPIGLYVASIGGGTPRQIGKALDRDIFSALWSADGRSLYGLYADRSIGKVGRFTLDGAGAATVATDVDGDFTVSSDGTVAYAAGHSDRPADVAVRKPMGVVTVLTHRNDALLAGKALGAVQPLAIRSSLDGAAVGAWLTLPAAYDRSRRYPLILNIHGGPHGYDGPVWNTRDQLYAAAGYAVLHTNYRGSTSYGLAFADRIARDPIAPSYADLMSATDAAVNVGIADPNRLFVTGGSAGGQLTAWIVGSTNRFKAAVAEKPVINLATQSLLSDQYTSSEMIAGTKSWDDPARFWASSPLSRASKVATPTMLIVGEQDRRTPVSEAQQFYNVLTLRHIPTALVLVPDASHSSIGGRPSQAGILAGITMDWFRRYDPKARTPVSRTSAP